MYSFHVVSVYRIRYFIQMLRMKYKTRLILFGAGVVIVLTLFLTNATTLFTVGQEKALPSLKLSPFKSESNLSFVKSHIKNAVHGIQNRLEQKSEEYHDDENINDNTFKETKNDFQVKETWGALKGPTLVSRVTMSDPTIDALFVILEGDKGLGFSVKVLRDFPYTKMATTLGREARQKAPGFRQYDNKFSTSKTTNFEKFHMGIKKYSLYDPENPAIQGLLDGMVNKPFHTVEMMTKGTELKLLIGYNDGTTAVFKPMRWPRTHETLPNHYYFNDYERHNAEIAAFHLDKVLGFYRVPPVTGRIVNMTTEIFDLADRGLRKTFYWSPIDNLCFFGDCTYYCDSRHSFCGKGDMIEGSLMVWLPPESIALRQRWKSPYRRSYSKFRKATWETDESYCDGVKKQAPYNKGRFLLDVVDMHIFDFLTGNMDRHHVEIFREFGNFSFLIHLDNGRGFGKTKVDEFSILTPLRQCCVIRLSTFIKFAKLYIGPERLGDVLDSSMKSDPVHPVLTDAHLDAVDRRVMHVLRTVAKCVEKVKRIDQVIIKDEF